MSPFALEASACSTNRLAQLIGWFHHRTETGSPFSVMSLVGQRLDATVHLNLLANCFGYTERKDV